MVSGFPGLQSLQNGGLICSYGDGAFGFPPRCRGSLRTDAAEMEQGNGMENGIGGVSLVDLQEQGRRRFRFLMFAFGRGPASVA